jgi:hypothetical protein
MVSLDPAELARIAKELNVSTKAVCDLSII